MWRRLSLGCGATPAALGAAVPFAAISLARAVALAVAVVGPLAGPAAAQTIPEDPGFAVLAAQAQSDPAAALARVDALLAAEANRPAPDRRLQFDLARLRVDLLLAQDAQVEAAEALVEMAGFAATFRDLTGGNPALLLAEAVRLFEGAEEFEAAIEAQEALIEDYRDGARPADLIAEAHEVLVRLAEALGDAAALAYYRDLADAAWADAIPPQAMVIPPPDGGAGGLLNDGGFSGGGPGDGPTTLGPLPGGGFTAELPLTGTRGAAEGFHSVDVYYATDRARSVDAGAGDPAAFYGSGRGDLERGIATVTIPHTHTPGVVEAPSIWRLEFRPDPAKHVVLQSVTPLDADSYYTRMQAEFDGKPEREALVFIHGYNVTFDGAARRAAQLAYDMDYVGVPILYSWPSRGSTVKYVADTAVVRLSARRLTHFLDEVVDRSGAEVIHVVAHSMGNRALTDALELMALRRGVGPGDPPVFGQVLFAAPDVDAGLFRAMLPVIRPLARRLTLYASEADWALAASRKLHGDLPRAGLGGAETLTDPLIDSIDMSELGDDMLAHSYFADDSSALADMMTLFWRNTNPASRCGLRAQGSAEPPAWRYQRGACADRNLIDLLGHMRREKVQSLDQARAILGRTVQDPDLAQRLDAVVAAIVQP